MNVRIDRCWLLVLSLWAVFAHGEGALGHFEDEALFRYRHATPQFSVEYPWTWVTNEASPPVVHDVGSPEQLPSLRLMVMDEPWWLPLRFAGWAASTQLQRLGRDLDIIGSELIEVDGLPMELTEIRWTINVGPGVDLHTLLASTFIDDHWVILMLSTGQQASHRGGLEAGEEEPFPAALRAVALSLRAGG